MNNPTIQPAARCPHGVVVRTFPAWIIAHQHRDAAKALWRQQGLRVGTVKAGTTTKRCEVCKQGTMGEPSGPGKTVRQRSGGRFITQGANQ